MSIYYLFCSSRRYYKLHVPDSTNNSTEDFDKCRQFHASLVSCRVMYDYVLGRVLAALGPSRSRLRRKKPPSGRAQALHYITFFAKSRKCNAVSILCLYALRLPSFSFRLRDGYVCMRRAYLIRTKLANPITRNYTAII